jgi:penicillin-binding protein 2
MNSETELNPQPGKDLYMTLDIRVQDIAEKAFVEDNGALVALDPRNGEVIAFVSIPTFDPNLFVNGIDAKTYRELSTSKDRPLFNRALQGQYPPGSTLKPFIGLAGLESNLVTSDESLKCPGYYKLKNDERKYRDWKKEGHGETDLTKALVESCDVYFYDLALALKIDRMESYLSRFGMGKQTGIDIRGEATGLLPSRQWKRKTYHLPWFPGETLITGIGQGFTLTTPLQLAHITATLGNRGERYKPRIIHAIGEPGLEEISIQKPRYIGKVEKDDPEHWKIIINAMTDVVHSIYGTARRINRDLEYKVAGKTGTAQVFGIAEDEEYDEEKIAKKLRDHALFISFAPVDEPKIAVAVIVENGGSGGAVAAPIARKVMDAYLLKDH